MGLGEMVLRILGAIAALALVLFLAWFILRWLNRRVPSMGGGGGKAAGRMITVLDRVHLGKNSSLLLVRVQDKVYLVGISEHTVQTLAEIDDPDGELALPEAGQNPSFTAALRDAVAKMGVKPKDDHKGGSL